MPAPFRDTLKALKARAARLDASIEKGRKQVAALEEEMRVKRRSEKALLHDPARRRLTTTAVIGFAFGFILTAYLFVRGCTSH